MTDEKKSTSYYSLTAVSSIGVLFILLGWLHWPLTATLILGVTLFIQIMYLFKKVSGFWLRAKDKGLNYEMILNLRPDISSIERNTEADIH